MTPTAGAAGCGRPRCLAIRLCRAEVRSDQSAGPLPASLRTPNLSQSPDNCIAFRTETLPGLFLPVGKTVRANLQRTVQVSLRP